MKVLALPALRHLHIFYGSYKGPGVDDTPAWLPFLRMIGKELRSLFVSMRELSVEFPWRELWTICPKVEDLFIEARQPTTPPPEGHPLHTLGRPYWYVTSGTDLQSFVSAWTSLRTIRIDKEWQYWMEARCGPLTSFQLKFLETSRLCLQDQAGESYTEYLSRC
ncbi:hypothetical protein CPB86DRAFT_810176 [Serendipita vermifera]|nr:hypothetical protein CPB86DRAFT_810176 [Serendipita vermifera]